MKSLKIISLLFLISILSCQKKTVREDIIERFPNNKIDTLLSFDFDENKIPDNICLLSSLNKEPSIYDNNQSIILYMNNKFISKNDNILPLSKSGFMHMINLENRKNTLLIKDELTITRPTSSNRLTFAYNKKLNKIILDSFKASLRIDGNGGMPFYKIIKDVKISKNKIYTLENSNFLTEDSLDFKTF